jgi:uncharacterized protein (TIGR03435 family)
MKHSTGDRNFSRHLLSAAVALTAVAVAANVCPVLEAQSVLVFEVASIKPHPSGDRAGAVPQFMPGGRFHVAGLPLQFTIAFAYNLPFQGTQLSGGPAWIRSQEDAYDIEAKADLATLKDLSRQEREDKLRLMLQALLAERFGLTILRETKEQPIYILTVAKNGPKLQKSALDPTDCDDPANHCHAGGSGQGRGIHVKAFRMADLAVSLSNFTDRPLIDRTGLTGLYDIDTEGWVPMRPRPPRPPGQEPTAEDVAFADPARPTLFMIFDKLGLKMESSRANVEMVVIDRVEKPTAN